VYLIVAQAMWLTYYQSQSPRGNAKKVLANFFVLSIFGQFDYELESRLLKSENRFHAQHILPRAVDKLTDDQVATIYEAYQADIYLSLEDFRREVARWRTHSVITKRNDLPTTLCTTLHSVNPVLYPSIDTILIKLCVLLAKPVASATAEVPFSVLRRLQTYVRSTMKNDRLSFLGLMHILIEILKWTCTKQWKCSYLLRHEGQILDNFKKFLSIKVIKIVLDSILYETLKWDQIAPFCIS
jgi:hypothetical protein